ncbi:PQQ-binding-like beta-propeller repeat protein [Mycolicibacterium sp. HK-90]|uniref:outer membrane protein assembly factor BamB family protein n=1 Tax=Mycolicibacterium sp. HK-90 TaxID=3056937 RepID=UPI00265A625C|nr:PQQ-binding-like beta-propeller repeat protein [Mycolicibacterium sp. HK-90]WKG04411.1 PQQ-binding-like beta-propeller repeat protein [Mycolicibacterium sp. HK-90]
MATAGDAHPRLARALVSLSIGIAVGSVPVSLYAFTQRVPDGLVSDRLGSVTLLLGGSLVAVAVVAAVLGAGGVAALAGRAIAWKAAWALALLAAVTSFMYLGSLPHTWTEPASGPGSRPLVALIQVAWLLLTVAAVLLVAGAIAAHPDGQPLNWRAAVPFVASGLVAALVAALGLVALSRSGEPRATTAAPIAVPDVPTTVGAETYTLTVKRVDTLVPAGPGFVLVNDSTLIGYDGATGSPRWRFPLDSLRDGCLFQKIRSTGTAADAMVLVECDHDAGYSKPRTDPFLVGLDAMTGQVRWSLDRGWSLRSRISLPSDTVPVVSSSRNELGSLDPRTGELRWTWSFAESDRRCSDTGLVGALDHTVTYAVPCGDSLRIHVFEARDGSERVIEHPVSQGFSTHSRSIEPLAYHGAVAVIQLRLEGDDPYSVITVDTRTGKVDELADPGFIYDLGANGSGQYPGPILELPATGARDFISLYRLGDNTTIRTTDVETYGSGNSYAPPSGQAWAQVGDRMVTAAAYDADYNNMLVSVSSDGSSSRRPSPCGRDIGGVVAVPGAVLVLCQRTKVADISGYDILGLRPT